MQTRRRVVIGFEAGRSSAPDGLITSDVANHQDDNEQLAVHTGRWRGVAGRGGLNKARAGLLSVRPVCRPATAADLPTSASDRLGENTDQASCSHAEF